MFIPRLIIPGQQNPKIMMYNGKTMNIGRTRTYRYSDLFPPDVIEDMGVDPNAEVTISLHKGKFHLRWVYVGWPTVIEIASLTSTGGIGWRVVCNACGNETLTHCWNNETMVGSIPQCIPVSGGAINFSNIQGMSGDQAAAKFNDAGYSQVPALSTDSTYYDSQIYDAALYLNDLPLFRTWHLTHESEGVKYSVDNQAFKNIDLDTDNNRRTYELQMNDANSHGQSSYDDAAFVFYRLGY